MSALQRIATPVVRTSVRRYGGGHVEPWFKPNYDSLPVPKGSWQADYDRKNRYGNAVLAVGIVAFSATVLHALQDPLRPVTKADLPCDPRTGKKM